MKIVYSNDEIAHIWAHNGQNEARNSNQSMSFHGDKFYSYNTVIALRHGGTYILSERDYSVTTAKHKAHVRGALRGQTVVYCYDVNDSPAQNFDTLKNEVLRLIERQKTARKIDYISQAEGSINSFKRYADLVGYKIPAVTVDEFITVDAKIKKAAEVARKKAETARKKAGAEFAKTLDTGRIMRAYNIARQCFHRGHVPTYRKITRVLCDMAADASRYGVADKMPFIYPDLMRVIKGGVITSQGVTITTEEARGLYLALKSGADIMGAKVAHYTINAITPDYVRAGCHTFPRDELGYISERLFGEAV